MICSFFGLLINVQKEQVIKESAKRQSETESLLKEYDIARFFPKLNERLEKFRGDSEKKRADKEKKELNSAHQRNGSEIMNRIPFRREHSDFYIPSRHSAYLEEKSILLPSSMRRGSEVAGLQQNGGRAEPVLTGLTNKDLEHQPIRPRRQRTEGDIVLQRSARSTLEGRRPTDSRKFFTRSSDKVRNHPYLTCNVAYNASTILCTWTAHFLYNQLMEAPTGVLVCAESGLLNGHGSSLP